MSLELNLTSRTQLPPDSIKSAPPPTDNGSAAGPAPAGVAPASTAPASTTPAAVYTPGVAPSNAGAYFRPAPIGTPSAEPSSGAVEETAAS